MDGWILSFVIGLAA